MPPDLDTSVPSSPDPLGNSSLADMPIPSPTNSAVRQTPLNKAITPSKNPTNNIKLQDFILKTPPAGLLRQAQSPTKSTAKTENLLSPWRIRVTVEAERDEDKQGAGGRTSERTGESATKRGTGRTTTTLVPLKGLEDFSPPLASRRSARSRKSNVISSPPKGGGVAALVRKRGRRLMSGEDDVGRDLSVGATPGKRARGRPRKSLPVVDDEDVVMMEAAAGKPKPKATPLVKKSRGERKATIKTPMRVEASPRLPPPIQQGGLPNSSAPTSKAKRDTPKLSRVVWAGIALQGVLDNNAREINPRRSSLRSPYVSPANKGSSGKSPKERLDDLFEGFGPGTRRELRAGLRLGEELARRHKLAAQAQRVGEPSALVATEDDMFTEANDTGYPKLPTPEDKDDYALAVPAPAPQQVIEYPSLQPEQLLSPERSEREEEDEMDWQVETPVKTQNLNISDSISEQDISKEPVASTYSEEREAQWQREREVISRQIEAANSSQVIVINSDDTEAVDEKSTLQDDDGNATDVDIFQAEASPNNYARASASVDGDLFPEEVAKPRRSKIPSPWRRNSQMVYSDEATEYPSGLFWQPDQRAIQLAKEREERRRRKDGHLDVSGMLKTTEKVKEEMRAITNDSTDVKIDQVLQSEVEIIVKEEQTLQLKTIVESSCHSKEAMVTAHGKPSSEIESDREESEYSEEATAPVHGDQSPEVASNSEDLYDSEDDMTTAERDRGSETESNAESTYYSEAEEEEEEEAAEPPTRQYSRPTKITPAHYLQAYLKEIRKAPPKPVAPEPTTWLGKLTSIACSFLKVTPNKSDTWTDAEYLLLNALYQRAKVDATYCPFNPNGGIWGFRLCLGHTLVCGKNYSLKIAKRHLGIVDTFREIVRIARLSNGGDGSVEWGDYEVVQRLFSVIVCEDMRARGIE